VVRCLRHRRVSHAPCQGLWFSCTDKFPDPRLVLSTNCKQRWPKQWWPLEARGFAHLISRSFLYLIPGRGGFAKPRALSPRPCSRHGSGISPLGPFRGFLLNLKAPLFPEVVIAVRRRGSARPSPQALAQPAFHALLHRRLRSITSSAVRRCKFIRPLFASIKFSSFSYFRIPFSTVSVR